MELATFDWLLSPIGQRALSSVANLVLSEASLLTDLALLRRRFDSQRASALVEVTLARRRAITKFALAEQMYFTREALEQAAPAEVATHTAARFAGRGVVADLGCGIGGDTLALARRGQVIAVERDPVRLAMARANLLVHGLADRVTFQLADFTTQPLPVADALFVDPARRSAGQRRLNPADYQPSLATVVGWAATIPAIGLKVAPGIADEAVPPGWECEFIARDDDLKAAVLWHGPLCTCRRRATLLTAGRSLTDGVQVDQPAVTADRSLTDGVQVDQSAVTADRSLTDGVRVDQPAVTARARRVAPVQAGRAHTAGVSQWIRQGEPDGYLYEPNPAIIRAHLIDQLAVELDAWQIDPTIAFLCSATAITTPLARWYAIESWQPFNLKALNRHLRQHGIGRVIIKKRGSPLDPQEFERRLTLTGPAQRVLVLTRVAGRPAIIICHPPPAHQSQPR